MKRKQLESLLSTLKSFENPKVLLEQYQTSAELAATILHTMEMNYGDIKNKFVADFGCGCGTFLSGAVALGADFCVGFDVDTDALDICRENLSELELDDNVDLLQADISTLSDTWREKFDVVVMNPPFGTKKNEGIDMKFLKVASELSRESVYSLHKTSTREVKHVLRRAADWNLDAQVISELKFDLPRSMKFHAKQSVDVNVDFIRFKHKKRQL